MRSHVVCRSGAASSTRTRSASMDRRERQLFRGREVARGTPCEPSIFAGYHAAELRAATPTATMHVDGRPRDQAWRIDPNFSRRGLFRIWPEVGDEDLREARVSRSSSSRACSWGGHPSPNYRAAMAFAKRVRLVHRCASRDSAATSGTTVNLEARLFSRCDIYVTDGGRRVITTASTRFVATAG